MRCRAVPGSRGSDSAAVCSLAPRPGRAVRCRDPATPQIPPALGRQPFCFASEEAHSKEDHPAPFQIALSHYASVYAACKHPRCPHAPLLSPGEGGSEQKAVPLLSCLGSIPLVLLYTPGAGIGPGDCRRGCSTPIAAGSSSVCPPHEAELRLRPMAACAASPPGPWEQQPWGGGSPAPPGPAAPGSPPGQVPPGVERALTPLCCDEDPGRNRMSSRGMAAPSKAEQG